MVGFNPGSVSTASPPQARAPDGVTLYAIGDVHGRADLLKSMIEQIRSDRRGSQDPAELIFLGDYIDRGPASYAVIDQILDLRDDANFAVTTLKGNHESMALQFLADPAVGPFWCRIGGRETLLSYGVTAPAGLTDIEDWEAVRRAFNAALPDTHLSFLQRLSIYAERGGYIFVHAGLRPGIALAEQREWDMLWIRDEFLDHRDGFGKVVVHGHTPEEEPFVGPNRIGLDTAADVTNRLTGVKLAGVECRLISVSNSPLRHSRSTEQNMYQAARPLPEPPSPAIRPVQAGVAPDLRPRPAWTPAMVSALSAGVVALGGAAYLMTAPIDRGPLSGPEPSAEARGATGQIDDLIAQVDKAILAAQKTRELADASIQSLSHDRPDGGPVASDLRRPDTGQPQSSTARAPADRPASEPRTATAAVPLPNRASRTAPVVARTAARAATADRTAVTAATPNRSPPAAKPSEPSRPADRPKEVSPSRTAGAKTGAGAASAAKPAPAVRSAAAAGNVIADATATDEGTLPASRMAAAGRNVGQTAIGTGARGDSLDQSTSSERTGAYTRSVPIKNANRIGQDDYPDASIQAGEEGVVGVRYVVDIRGRVSACAATETSNHARLDKRTCDLIRRRFRFKPAARNGQPVEEVREQRIRWMLCPGQDAWGMSGRDDHRSDRPCPA